MEILRNAEQFELSNYPSESQRQLLEQRKQLEQMLDHCLLLADYQRQLEVVMNDTRFTTLCCNNCVTKFEDAGQLMSWREADGCGDQHCEQCGAHLTDSDQYMATVEL